MLFSQQVIVQNTSEIVRLKGNYLQFWFLQVTKTYEHFTSIHEHFSVFQFCSFSILIFKAGFCYFLREGIQYSIQKTREKLIFSKFQFFSQKVQFLSFQMPCHSVHYDHKSCRYLRLKYIFQFSKICIFAHFLMKNCEKLKK